MRMERQLAGHAHRSEFEPGPGWVRARASRGGGLPLLAPPPPPPILSLAYVNVHLNRYDCLVSEYEWWSLT